MLSLRSPRLCQPRLPAIMIHRTLFSASTCTRSADVLHGDAVPCCCCRRGRSCSGCSSHRIQSLLVEKESVEKILLQHRYESAIFRCVVGRKEERCSSRSGRIMMFYVLLVDLTVVSFF